MIYNITIISKVSQFSNSAQKCCRMIYNITIISKVLQFSNSAQKMLQNDIYLYFLNSALKKSGKKKKVDWTGLDSSPVKAIFWVESIWSPVESIWTLGGTAKYCIYVLNLGLFSEEHIYRCRPFL